MSKSKKEIPVVKIVASGALIRLHNGNRNMLKVPGRVESTAVADPDTGKLIEVGGSEQVKLAEGSKDLPKIAEALRVNASQRDRLLRAALVLPDAEEFLKNAELYDGESDRQYIDPNTLKPVEGDDEGIVVPDPVASKTGLDMQVENVTDKLNKNAKNKKTATAKDDGVDKDDLADL